MIGSFYKSAIYKNTATKKKNQNLEVKLAAGHTLNNKRERLF